MSPKLVPALLDLAVLSESSAKRQQPRVGPLIAPVADG